MDKSFY
jgi:hypothetical protein